MEPANIRFGGGATETLLNPFWVVWALIAIVLILTLPRQKAITPFLLAFFTIPLGQGVMVGSLHFAVLRILILTGLGRWAIPRAGSSKSKFPGGINALDHAVLRWAISTLAMRSLQWLELTACTKFVGDFLDAV